ncbi:MAG TPA: DUF952 domain-containing protein [Anaerolineales bacterium]
MEWIVHICPESEWQAAQANGVYRSPSLDTEGFIHCSRPAQLLDVANRYYRGREGLLLLWIDPGRVQAEIRWEESDGQAYPHIYGPLNLDTIIKVTDLTSDADGVFRHT